MTRCVGTGPGGRPCARAWWHDGRHASLDGYTWNGAGELEYLGTLDPSDEAPLAGCAGVLGGLALTAGAVLCWALVRLLRRLL